MEGGKVKILTKKISDEQRKVLENFLKEQDKIKEIYASNLSKLKEKKSFNSS